MHSTGLTFSKDERLCSQRMIDRLYSDGRRMLVFPYSIQWREEPSLDVPCQVMIVAPKRKFHHAVDRNRVKRMMRECYRHLKPSFYATLDAHNIRLTLSLVYIHNEILSYENMYRKMDNALAQLSKELTEHANDATEA